MTWMVWYPDMFLFMTFYEFKVGATPGRERKRDYVDNPNGLFSAQAAPKPPAVMYSAVEGMKVGGKVIFSYFNYQNNSLFFYLRKTRIFILFCCTEEGDSSSRGRVW